MKILKKLFGLFTKKNSKSIPLLIIHKITDDGDVKEFTSIEEAILDLENDPNVPTEKLEKLKTLFKNLRKKSSIKIKDGEILR